MSFIAGSSQKTLLVLYIKAALRTCDLAVVFFTPRLFLLVLFFVDDCHRAHSVPLEASCSFPSEFTAQVPHSWHCPGCDFSCTPVRECLSSASPLSLTCHRSTFFFTHFQIFRTPLIWNVECESLLDWNKSTGIFTGQSEKSQWNECQSQIYTPVFLFHHWFQQCCSSEECFGIHRAAAEF